jgi:hypothetical protein
MSKPSYTVLLIAACAFLLALLCTAFPAFFASARHLSAISEISSCVRCSIPINVFCAHSNEFIKLCLNSRGIAILSVLNNEHHQKRDDHRSCIDNQLPGVGVMENGACDSPHDDNECCKQKRNRPPRLMGDSSRDVAESALSPKSEHSHHCGFDRRAYGAGAAEATSKSGRLARR